MQNHHYDVGLSLNIQQRKASKLITIDYSPP